jgi:N-methylhydantoinase B
VIAPVFIDGALFGFAGSIAHKSDIGGPVAGSCSSQAREIFNEGLQIPAVRYASGPVINRDIERIIAANSRTPELVLGDIRAARRRPARRGAARRTGAPARHGESPRRLRPAVRDRALAACFGDPGLARWTVRGRALCR